MIASTIRRVLGVLAGAAVVAGMSLAFSPTASAATSQPFACSPGKVILEVGNTQLYTGTFSAGSISFTTLGTQTGPEWNAMGHSPIDGFLYAVDTSGDNLLRFSNDGSETNLGPLSQSLPFAGSSPANIGAFDDAGTFWVGETNAAKLYQIDVGTRQVTAESLSEPIGASDVAFSKGYLWGMGSSNLRRVDVTSGQVVMVPITGTEDIPIAGAGGAFTYGNGDLGFYDQVNSKLYRVHIDNPTSGSPTAQVISTQSAPANGVGDATSCFPTAVVAGVDLQVSVQAPAAVPPVTAIDYTVTVHNNGPSISSGWTVTDTLPANLTDVTTDTTGCSINAGTLSCTGGTLIAGGDAVIHFTGTAPSSGTVVDPATVYANEADTNPNNDHGSATTQVAVTPGAPMVSAAGLGAIGGAGALAFGVVLLIRRRRRAIAPRGA